MPYRCTRFLTPVVALVAAMMVTWSNAAAPSARAAQNIPESESRGPLPQTPATPMTTVNPIPPPPSAVPPPLPSGREVQEFTANMPYCEPGEVYRPSPFPELNGCRQRPANVYIGCEIPPCPPGTSSTHIRPRGLAVERVVVTIGDDALEPPEIVAPLSTEIIWVNNGRNQHRLTAPGRWTSDPLRPGDQWSIRIAVPGTFDYHDTLYPEIQGRVIIQVQ